MKEGEEELSNIGNKETFAKNLLYYIERSGRSQKEIAEVVGVSPSTFNEWVKGKKYPRIDKIEMLANFFHVQKSALIEERAENDNTFDKRSLNEGEAMLLDLFSQLSFESQQMVVAMIKIALNKK